MENKADDEEADEFASIFGNAKPDPPPGTKTEAGAAVGAKGGGDTLKGSGDPGDNSGESDDEIGIEVAPTLGSATGTANGSMLLNEAAVASAKSPKKEGKGPGGDGGGGGGAASPSSPASGGPVGAGAGGAGGTAAMTASPSPSARRRRRSRSGSSGRSQSPRRESDSKRRASMIDEGGIDGKPRVDPLMFKTLGVDEERSEPGPTIYDIDLDSLEEKPWREVGADITDWFNYGFDEQSWRDYCSAQVRVRVGLSKRGGGSGKPLPGITSNSPGLKKMGGGPGGSNQVGVCFDFQNKGFCVRGASCRWRHVQKETPQGRGVCYDFQNKGFCSRGNNCRWWHVPKEDGSTPVIPPDQVEAARRRHASERESDDGRVKNFLRQLPQVSSLLNPMMGGVAGAMLANTPGAELLQGAAARLPLLGAAVAAREGERRRDRERRKRRRRRSRSESRSRSRSRRRRRG